jgi:hypothetical protein
MSSGYAVKGVLSPLEVKKAWKAHHPALVAKAAKAAKPFNERKV